MSDGIRSCVALRVFRGDEFSHDSIIKLGFDTSHIHSRAVFGSDIAIGSNFIKMIEFVRT